MRFKTTLILLGIFAAAALFFFTLERPRHDRSLERAARKGRLAELDPRDVNRMTIARPDVTIDAEREGDHWRLLSPVEDRADDSAVNTLLEAVCGARAEEEFDFGASPASEFGLDSVSTVLRLTGKEGEDLLDLRIGEFNPAKSQCYAARRGGGKVLLLPAGIRRYALRPLFDFRYKRIFDVPVSDVYRIEIESATRSMAWGANSSGEWVTVQNGDTIRGDKSSVENIVRTLRGLRAKDIPFGAPLPTAGREAARAGTISVRFRPDSAEVVLTFSDPLGEGCYVESSANRRVALVDTTVLDVFVQTVATLRDRRMFRSDFAAAVRMTLATPRISATLVKTDSKWTFANPEFGDLDAETARLRVSRIESAKFDSVLDEHLRDPLGYGFDTPHLRLTLFAPGDRVIDALSVGGVAPDGFSRYASTLSTGLLGTVDPVTLAEIEKSFGVPASP